MTRTARYSILTAASLSPNAPRAWKALRAALPSSLFSLTPVTTTWNVKSYNRLFLLLVSVSSLGLLLACGTTSSKTPVGPPPPPPSIPNVLPVTVNAGNNSLNIISASVTVCMPGTSTCQTVNNVMVDTGSTGLRLFSDTLSLSLPQISTAAGPSFECGVFPSAGQFTWGSMVTADVNIAGETAPSLPIQIIGDPSQAPASCSSGLQGVTHQNAPYIGGIMGISTMPQDCPGCALTPAPQFYYACQSAGACQPAIQPLNQQAENPVVLFSTDNNGEIVELPTVPSSGSSSATGSVIFGIGTQTNNQIGSAVVFQYPLTTSLGGASYPTIVDSGSSANDFPDAFGFPVCNGFYCPSPTSVGATMQGQNGAYLNFNLFAADPTTLTVGADSAVAGPAGQSVTLGVPFFFGQNLFFAIQGQNTPSGMGPYLAIP